MDGDESVDWGVEEDIVPHSSFGDSEPRENHNSEKTHSPPRTEMDEDAISLGGEDDDTEALMTYSGSAEPANPVVSKTVKTAAPVVAQLAKQAIVNGDTPPATKPNEIAPAENKDTKVQISANGPINTTSSPPPKPARSRPANDSLPILPANVGLPARPNFEATQRVRILTTSTRLLVDVII